MTRPAVATALASAAKPLPELAAEVVSRALERTGADIARSVLLFLTSDFARHAREAVAAASRAARCLQVAGCTGAGVFTEQDWVLDRPAACALVLATDTALAGPGDGEALLSLALPETAVADWISSPPRRFGLISSDTSGHEAGRIWGNGKLLAEGRFEIGFRGARLGIGVSRGVRALSGILTITGSEGYDVLNVGNHPALDTLLRELPLELRALDRLPYHMLFAGVIEGETAGAIEQGRYTLASLIASSTEDRSVTLGARLEPGTRLFWCLRQALAAERDTRIALDTAARELGGDPEFALMLSCLGRGPYFFGGADRDLEILRQRYPGMPIVGAYGAGQIVPLPMGNRLIHNSALIALFKSHVQSES